MRVVDTFRKALRSAEQQGKRVRALGSNASLSNHAGQDHIVSTTAFDQALPLWTGLRAQTDASSLIQVECGMRVNRLCARLRRQGRMLENIAAYTGQTVVGAMATATHGTGLHLPPMCDQVVSMVLVTRGGEALRVEPINGPTDPVLHREPGITLVQDDALFHCALTGMGAFGMVAAVTLQTRLHVPLWEQRLCGQVATALDAALPDPASVRHASMLFSAAAHRGERTAVVTVRDVTDPLRLRDALTPRQRWIPVLFSHLPLDPILRQTLRRRPRLAPAVITHALRTTARRQIRSHAGRILDNYPLNRCAPARAVELFVPLSKWKAAVRDIECIADQEQRAGRYLTAPVSVRFVAASKHLLAPTFGQAGAMIELVHLKGTAQEEHAMDPYLEAVRTYSGRMHLGLETPGLRLARDYDELPAWQATRRQYDPGPAVGLPQFVEAA